LRVFGENLCVYGADKVWDRLGKDGTRVARCTVERLMAGMGLQGCRRGRISVRATVSDETLDCPGDLVERRLEASAPKRLWLADLTYVKTSTGWVYVAFIVDVYSRMVVGWQASRSLRTGLAIDALETAVYSRGRTDSLEELTPTRRGNAVPTRTPTDCSANTSRKAPTSPGTPAVTSTPSPSTVDPAKPSAGRHPLKPSTSFYTPVNKAVM
jgi:transposase InsO family protein